MAKDTLDHKCPSCSATLKFNPHGQNWVCEYCGSEFKLEDLEKKTEKLTKKTEEVKVYKDQNGMDVYTCPNCGAQIIASEEESATFCVYCRSTAILKNKLVGKFNPSFVIPFKNTKEDAIAAFKSIGKGRPLMPKVFSDPKNINDMKGVYIPFWIYDYNVNGSINVDAKRVSSYISGGYQVTKTDIYDCYRAGEMSYTKVPVDGSTHFDDDIMDSIEPFDYNDLKEFSYSYLSGFLAEKYDVDSNQASERAIERTKNSTIEVLKDDVKGYTSKSVKSSDINCNLVKSDYILIPVWMLNIKYNDKLYKFAMNGQTGKMVGNIPVDKKKAWLYFFAILGISFIILLIIFLLMGWL